MAICRSCGATVPDGKPFCGNCGYRMEGSAQAAPAPAQQSRPRYTAAPVFNGSGDMRPPKGTRYAVMGVGSFLGTLILMMIPVVNIILLIVWACGGAYNQNKRNYARAMLILLIIILVLDIGLLTLLMATGVLTPETFYDIAAVIPA